MIIFKKRDHFRGKTTNRTYPLHTAFIFHIFFQCISPNQLRSVQSLSRVLLFVTPWTAARQTSWFITNSWSLLKLMSIESLMPSNHLILCQPLLLPSTLPSIRVFFSESVLPIRWPKYRISVSAPVLPMNIQNWVPLRLTGLISLQSKGLSRAFSNTTV